MINRQSRLNNLPVSEETSSSSFTAKMTKLLNVEQLLGIGMMIVMTILLWGDWTTMAFLYIPLLLTLGVIRFTKWWQAHRSKS